MAAPPRSGETCVWSIRYLQRASSVSARKISAPLSNQGEHYTLQTPQAGSVYPGISSKIPADGFKHSLWSQIWRDADFPPFIFQSFPEIPPPFICSSFVTNAFPCATSPAENWLIGLLLVPRYVLQMPRTSCKGQVTCFLMLAL